MWDCELHFSEQIAVNSMWKQSTKDFVNLKRMYAVWEMAAREATEQRMIKGPSNRNEGVIMLAKSKYYEALSTSHCYQTIETPSQDT